MARNDIQEQDILIDHEAAAIPRTNQLKEILTMQRNVAVFTFGLEVASAIMEQISAEIHGPKLHLLSLLNTIFSLLTLLLAVLEMIYEARRCRRWFNSKVQCLNVIFAFAQATTSLLNFILLLYKRVYPIRFSVLPLIFSLTIVVLSFIPHQTETIEIQLICNNQTHRCIEEKVNGEYMIHFTSNHELSESRPQI